MNAHAKMIVCGSFGYGNVGDEAVPLAIGDLAEAGGCRLDLEVVTRFAEPDMPSITSMEPEGAMRRAGFKGLPVIFSGGGIIEPNISSVLMRCQALASSPCHPAVSLFGSSVEAEVRYPLLNRHKIRRLLKRFDQLLVRDQLSCRVLQSMIPKRQVEVIGDVVLGMRASKMVPKAIEAMKPYIAVALTPLQLQVKAPCYVLPLGTVLGLGQDQTLP